MPDADVLDVGVLFADLVDCHFHAIRKAFGVALEAYPSALELALAVVVLISSQQASSVRLILCTYQRLPIVVDDEVRY